MDAEKFLEEEKSAEGFWVGKPSNAEQFLELEPTGGIKEKVQIFLKRFEGKEVISTPEGDYPIEMLQDESFRDYLGEKYGIPEAYWQEPKTAKEAQERINNFYRYVYEMQRELEE